MRRLLPLLALLAAAGCRLDPAGQCDVRADCSPGLDCLNGVCAACTGDGDCGAWQACGLDGLCAARATFCDGDADCATWARCAADHRCALRAGRCADDAGCDAASFERCDPEHRCTRQPGRCLADADCLAWTPTCDVAANRCRFGAAAGDDVLAWGTLVEGSCDRAVSRATTAAASAGVEVGFDCDSGADGKGAVDPVTGAVLYRHVGDAGGDTLRRFHRDAIEGAARAWRYPVDPVADDDAIVPAACPMTWDRWVVQGETGAILFGCPLGGLLRDFYDEAGVLALSDVREVLAWSASGHRLAVAAGGALVVVDAAGVSTAVSGLPAGARHAVRTTADAWVVAPGFRVALHDDAATVDELWEIDETNGVAALAGTYAGVSLSYAGFTPGVIDSAGALYGRAFLGTLEVVLKRPFAPGTTVEVYGETLPAGADDYAAAVFKPYLRLDGSFLLTRP